MEKSNLLKVFSILILSVMVVLMATTVNAEDDGWTNMTQSLLGNNTSNTGNTGNTANTNANSTNTNRANTSNTNRNTNRSNTNSSIYNNTNLPKTGIGDSLPIAALVVIFGISAVYAYKKIKDYRNI